MKKLLAGVFIFTVSAFAQTSDLARATYAKNGVLIGLTNLVPLQNCRIEAMSGKVSSVEYRGDTVLFEIKKKKEKQTFQFSFSKLPNVDRRTLRRGFLKKGIPMKASGYVCKEEEPIQAISIDRSYERAVSFPY
jgi:hypothetical protein